jgi:hypothetical protein
MPGTPKESQYLLTIPNKLGFRNQGCDLDQFTKSSADQSGNCTRIEKGRLPFGMGLSGSPERNSNSSLAPADQSFGSL